MKMPGKELALVLVGLVALVAVWVFVFTSVQKRWRSGDVEVQPATETGAEPAADDAEEAEEAEAPSE